MMMVLTSTPRVRQTTKSRDPSSKLPSKLQQKWRQKAEMDYQFVYDIYMSVANKCLWWRHVILHSIDKKKRKDARNYFLKVYPTMRALNQIGMDDHLAFDTTLGLDRFYYRLTKR